MIKTAIREKKLLDIILLNKGAGLNTMAAAVNGELKSSKKRKKSDSESARRSMKRRAIEGENGKDKLEIEHIQELEDQIAESRKYYNNIVTLLSKLDDASTDKAGRKALAVSLCRVFCRLLAGGQLNPSKSAAESETILVAWLKERYQEYKTALVGILRDGEPSQQVCLVHIALHVCISTNIWTLVGYRSKLVYAIDQRTNCPLYRIRHQCMVQWLFQRYPGCRGPAR